MTEPMMWEQFVEGLGADSDSMFSEVIERSIESCDRVACEYLAFVMTRGRRVPPYPVLMDDE